MPNPGQTDIALSYSGERFDTYIFGMDKQDVSLRTLSYSLFLEHGLSQRSSVVVSVPYLSIDDENQGLQDASLFLKYRNQYQSNDNGTFSIITAVGLSFPLSQYPVDTQNPIGQRATIFGGRLLAQYNFNSGLFLHLQSGFDFRVIPEPQSAIPVLFRLGYGAPWFYIDGWLEYFHAFSSAVDTNIGAGSGSRWLRTGGTFYVPIKPYFGVFIGGALVLSGQNIGLSRRWNVGGVLKLGAGE
ncbi:MAG: hypothetical protein DHS20C18_08180 [Saprospiraceae bacterium]|nr:MAG: hypothetical protein DHS20C18_08180 [Saprospiraceae bacterium]